MLRGQDSFTQSPDTYSNFSVFCCCYYQKWRKNNRIIWIAATLSYWAKHVGTSSPQAGLPYLCHI